MARSNAGLTGEGKLFVNKLTPISAPMGPCPVKLTGTDRGSVLAWAEEVKADLVLWGVVP